MSAHKVYVSWHIHYNTYIISICQLTHTFRCLQMADVHHALHARAQTDSSAAVRWAASKTLSAWQSSRYARARTYYQTQPDYCDLWCRSKRPVCTCTHLLITVICGSYSKRAKSRRECTHEQLSSNTVVKRARIWNAAVGLAHTCAHTCP